MVIAHIRQPLSSMTTMNDQNAYAGSDKDALIESLRAELSVLEKQVGEFNDLRLSIVKVAGKNGVRKLKPKEYLSAYSQCGRSTTAGDKGGVLVGSGRNDGK